MALQSSHSPGLSNCLLPGFHASPLFRAQASRRLDLSRRRSSLQLESIFFDNTEPKGHILDRSIKKLVSCKCSLSSERHHAEVPESNKLVELPLFPLPLVLFPGATLPLQVFEFRYRMMMHTLLQTDLRFGIIYSDNTAGVVDVGCVGEVIKHERLVDDRFFLICKGQERFRVISLIRTRPYLVAEVKFLEDCPSRTGEEDVESLSMEVEACMKDVIRISNRLNGKPEKEVRDLRKNLFPTPFSFFVGSTFEGAPKEQQALLELEDTASRLKRERDTLKNTLNYLAAASAVRDVFRPS